MSCPSLRIPFVLFVLFFTSCNNDDGQYDPISDDDQEVTDDNLALLSETFGSNIDFNNLQDYSNQPIPGYITKDNTANNTITNAKATLGRILFYDTQLSSNNTFSCASCHQQGFAFGDNRDVSTGVNGTTGRHSMRLVNARFADETNFFWDERAATLEEQTTQPIRDHAEMGFSGQDGSPTFDDLLDKLAATDYYPVLFEWAYGDNAISENRLQETLAQFVRSIQSFDSRFDEGFDQAGAIGPDFPNYTDQENLGKRLFVNPPNQNGIGCMGCHRAPEFDIDPNSRNNGIMGVFGSTELDVTVTRSPTLRDLFGTNGLLNGAAMHDASIQDGLAILEHYNAIDVTGNTNLDNRLQGPGGNGQQLNLSVDEMEAVVAFLRTLTGDNIYTDPKWSNPFQ